MGKNLVSIITPCYNVEKTLERYLESVLKQTYKEIEVIAVDDGSTDHTAEIIKEYQDKYAVEGMQLKYVFQDNAGLGAAINTGLKYVDGAFLCWADPDDFFMHTSVEKRLKILLDKSDYDIVSSDAYVYDSRDLKYPIRREAEGFKHRFEPKQFEYLLVEQSHFCAGCHMIRMSSFDRINEDREIYPAKRGQNWQMLLPMYYYYKRYYLDEPLYAYVIYPKSMSQGDSTEDKELLRWKEHEEIILNTLNRIGIEETELNKYKELIECRYALKRFYTAIDFRDKKLLKVQYTFLGEKESITKDIRKLYLRNRYMFFKIIFKGINIIKRQ